MPLKARSHFGTTDVGEPFVSDRVEHEFPIATILEFNANNSTVRIDHSHPSWPSRQMSSDTGKCGC